MHEMIRLGILKNMILICVLYEEDYLSEDLTMFIRTKSKVCQLENTKPEVLSLLK